MIYLSNSPEMTINIASKLSESFLGGEIVNLCGDLGAGKTTFTKGIALGLHIEDIITSPTFTVMNEYDGRLKLYHYDMYRIKSADELIELGVEEYLYLRGVSVIEWNKFNLTGLKVINVEIEYIEDNIRRITIDEVPSS